MNRRSDYKTPTHALTSLRRARKTRFLYSEEWRTRQRPFDEELKADFGWLNQDWRTYFAQSSSSSPSSQNWWQHEHQHQDSEWHGHQDTEQLDHKWQLEQLARVRLRPTRLPMDRSGIQSFAHARATGGEDRRRRRTHIILSCCC